MKFTVYRERERERVRVWRKREEKKKRNGIFEMVEWKGKKRGRERETKKKET